MKFTSLQENLKKGISIVSHVNSKNINLPILNNILIKAESGEIKLISTNLEIGIIYSLRGVVDEPGETTVESKLINDYINLLSDEKVLFKKDEGEITLEIESGNYKTKIKIEDSKDFPLIPVINSQEFITCKTEDLKKSLNSVAFAVSNNENRVEISGVLFEIDGETMNLVATDSYRLATAGVKVVNGNSNPLSLIIPARTTQELLRVLLSVTQDFVDGDVKIYFSDNQVMFSVGPITLVSRLINGQYPDYRQIMPKNFKTEAIIPKNEFSRAIKTAALFSRSGVNDVYLKIVADELIISSSSSQFGESIVRIDIDKKGVDGEITLNHRYLIDGVNNISGDKVYFGMIDGNMPCAIQADEKDDYLYIVMPIRQ
jgi:DNA polymerase-3 subunit beta